MSAQTTADVAGVGKAQQAAVAAHGAQAPPTARTSATASDETIQTTEKHPWLTVDRGWLPAGELHLGERVVRADGTYAT